MSPPNARTGDVVEVRAGSYKRHSIRMPLYLVPRDKVPRFRRSVGAPRGSPYTFVGFLDFRKRRTVRMRFRIPSAAPGIYAFLIYCDACARGKRGSLITTTRVLLRIGDGTAAPAPHVTLNVERIFEPAYGGYKLRFTGVIPNGAANEYVGILHQRCGDGFSRAVAGASTREGGFYDAIPEYESPPASGTFRARWKGHLSEPVTLRPPVRVFIAKPLARRYHVHVLADSNLNGRFVVLQRLARGRWTHIRRARLTGSGQPVGEGVSYTATFTIRTRGLRLRILVPKRTAAPCHLSAASETFVS